MFKLSSINLILILSGLAVVLLVATVFLGTYAIRKTNQTANQNRAFITCVSAWANKTAERTSILTGINIARQNKLDILIRDFALAGSTDPKVKAQLRKTFFAHLRSYVRVSNAYKKAVKKHPLPKSPRFACTNPKK